MDAHEPHDARPLPEAGAPSGDPPGELAARTASGSEEWRSAPAVHPEGNVEPEIEGPEGPSLDASSVPPERSADQDAQSESETSSVPPERSAEGAESKAQDADPLTPRQPQGERETAPDEREAHAEAELRAVPPESLRRKSHVAPALIPLDRLDDDATFRLRPEGDLSPLATDIARLGQLFPVELRLIPPHRFQVVCGFRRVAALRFLKRDKVLARLHTDLSDEDALLMALASAIHGTQVARQELEAARERLDAAGLLSPAAKDMLEKALEGDALAPESPYEEIDADELAVDVTTRLGAINQDLALLADVFASLEPGRRAELLQQLQYSAELVAFLEGR